MSLKVRIFAVLLAAMAVGALPAWAAKPVAVLPQAALKGEPKISAGSAKAAYVWVDAKGVHVRWTSDGKPALFTGSLDLDKPFLKITRVNELAGGFVEGYGDRIVMFSATARDALDGFDLALPAGTSVKLEAAVDGAPMPVETLSFGGALQHAKELPVKFTR